MENKIYESPVVDICLLEVEKGYAASLVGSAPSWNNSDMKADDTDEKLF